MNGWYSTALIARNPIKFLAVLWMFCSVLLMIRITHTRWPEAHTALVTMYDQMLDLS